MATRATVPQAADLTQLDFTAFRAAASQTFVPLALHADRPETFTGRLRGVDLPDIHVSEIAATPHSVERTAELVARGERPHLKVSLQLAGTGLLIQDDREALLRPGDIALYDTARPYSLVFEGDMRMMVLMFPRDQLDLTAETIAQLTAVRFARGSGLTPLVASFLEKLTVGLTATDSAIGLRLARNAIDVVETMLAQELGTRLESGHRGRLFLRIRSYIDQHLADPTLDPARIASAHFISTRLLHALFHSEGTTVSAWIRTRRLEHCRRELTDIVFADHAVSAIAARWGLVDAAHFSRLFKATYGASPRDVRASALGGSRGT